MKVDHVFLSLNAADFAAQTDWWAKLIGRRPDREPMPSCREWDLAPSVLFQVLDDPKADRTAVSLRIDNLDAEIARLREAGIEVPDPQEVEGFDSLRWAAFPDPEGNSVNLLEGA